MGWQPITTAPRDGTPVKALCGRFTMMGLNRMEFTARFIDGRWCARFNETEWKPITPDPLFWRPATSVIKE